MLAVPSALHLSIPPCASQTMFEPPEHKALSGMHIAWTPLITHV
jgi:hypothetical protein